MSNTPLLQMLALILGFVVSWNTKWPATLFPMIAMAVNFASVSTFFAVRLLEETSLCDPTLRRVRFHRCALSRIFQHYDHDRKRRTIIEYIPNYFNSPGFQLPT